MKQRDRKISRCQQEAKRSTYLKFKVPKEALPVLDELIEKVPLAWQKPYLMKGVLILAALKFFNPSSPGGLFNGDGKGWRPSLPTDSGGWYQKSPLRLVE